MTNEKDIIDTRNPSTASNPFFNDYLMACSRVERGSNGTLIVGLDEEMVKDTFTKNFYNCIVYMTDSYLAQQFKQILLDSTTASNQHYILQVEIFPETPEKEDTTPEKKLELLRLGKTKQVTLDTLVKVNDFCVSHMSNFAIVSVNYNSKETNTSPSEQPRSYIKECLDFILVRSPQSHIYYKAPNTEFFRSLKKETDQRALEGKNVPMFTLLDYEDITLKKPPVKENPNEALLHRVLDEKKEQAPPKKLCTVEVDFFTSGEFFTKPTTGVFNEVTTPKGLPIGMLEPVSHEWLERQVVDLRDNALDSASLKKTLLAFGEVFSTETKFKDAASVLKHVLCTGVYHNYHFVVGPEFSDWVRVYEEIKDVHENTAAFSYTDPRIG